MADLYYNNIICLSITLYIYIYVLNIEFYVKILWHSIVWDIPFWGRAERGFSEHDGKSWHAMVGLAQQHGSFLFIWNGWNHEPLLIQTLAICLFLCQTLESYVMYRLAPIFALNVLTFELRWSEFLHLKLMLAVGLQCVHASVCICVGQMNITCYFEQKECQKRQLGQSHRWDRTTCLTLNDF